MTGQPLREGEGPRTHPYTGFCCDFMPDEYNIHDRPAEVGPFGEALVELIDSRIEAEARATAGAVEPPTHGITDPNAPLGYQCGDAACSEHGVARFRGGAAGAVEGADPPDVVAEIEHAVAALDEVYDLSKYGDSIESGLLEAHATLSTLLDRLRATTPEAPASPPPLDVRPQVAAFALVMEGVLRDNDDKGGWQDCDPYWLLGRLRQEMAELDSAMHKGTVPHTGVDGRTGDMPADPIRESADVANFAMMIADVLGGLASAAPSEPGEPRG